jgi:hypothetical protein
MRMNYEEPWDILLKYIIIHSTDDLGALLEEAFRDVANNSYNIKDISNLFFLEPITLNIPDKYLSLIKIQIIGMHYKAVEEFEEIIKNNYRIVEICKTYDSFKMEENMLFLAELYEIEMKIREIYTILARRQLTNIKKSIVRTSKEYDDNKDEFEVRLMNEFFFIEFSAYRDVDKRKEAKTDDLVEALRQAKCFEDISAVIGEISHPTLHLVENFNELSRIPEAIGRLGLFRNNIAHTRYLSEKDIGNFEKAKEIIEEVYINFILKLKSGAL